MPSISANQKSKKIDGERVRAEKERLRINEHPHVIGFVNTSDSACYRAKLVTGILRARAQNGVEANFVLW